MKIRVQAPGKLIWLGEYAVLEGAPAVVTAIDRFARVEVFEKPVNEGKPANSVTSEVLEIFEQGFDLEGTRVSWPPTCSPGNRKTLKFFEATLTRGLENLHELGFELAPSHFNLNTANFFLGRSGLKLGFGSSAALSVAVLGALLAAAGQDLRDPDNQLLIFQSSREAHNHAQGKLGSGIDIGASTFGGLLQYQLVQNTLTTPVMIEQFSFPRDLTPLYIWTGHSASTTEMVRQVNSFRNGNPQAFDTLMKNMFELGENGCRSLASGDVSAFLEIAEDYGTAMDLLGQKSGADIFSPPHQRLREIARTFSAAYKPSGAGGGDLGIAFARDPEQISALTLAINNAGFDIIELKHVSEGVHLQQEEEN
ncbi:MAG: hypothetical protein KDI06_03740 [Calditrichaeota bacterium]|nr:hypothetical protein [Calditrichota bacterium]